ncbi:MAG: peptide deformylase [Clostridiales bacterium]|nr:peptide deformylase [Clostridiales bacterium]
MRIFEHPNPALKQRAADVDPTADSGLSTLVARMARAMYDAPGVGLAATQIGVQKRVIVYDVDDELVVLCNPVITERSEECESTEEGCLSVPGIGIDISRNCRVTCEALSLTGEPLRIEADGLLARVLQHEIDHLDGVLILDRCDPQTRRDAIRHRNEIYHEQSQ